MSSKFVWQRNAEQTVAAFKEEAAAPTSKPRVFTFVQANSLILQFVHTTGKFFDMVAVPELLRKVMAFVGEKLILGLPNQSSYRKEMHGSGREPQCVRMR